MRLHDVGQPWVFGHFVLQQVDLLRQDEGFWQEVEMADSVPDLHARYIFVHEVLPSEVEGAGKMVDLLVGQQILVCFVFDNR